MYKKVFTAILVLSFQLSFSQSNSLDQFPKGHTPEEVGKLIAYRFVYANHALHGGKWISYPETFYWNGALNYARLTRDAMLTQFLRNRFEVLLSKEQQLLPLKNHVDLNMFGSLPLTLYTITKDQRYLDLGMPYANTQWEVPDNAKKEEETWADKGFSWQTRLWIDDMYMITIVQTQAYKAPGDQKHIDRAAREMVL